VPAQGYAGFGRRLAAVLLDALIWTPVSLLLPYAVYGGDYLRWLAQPIGDREAFYGAWDLFISQGLPPILVVALWRLLTGTPGKLLMGCQVVDARSGRHVSVGQAIARYLGYLVSALPLGLGFLWILWDRRRQGFHDKLARTLVIREQEAADMHEIARAVQ